LKQKQKQNQTPAEKGAWLEFKEKRMPRIAGVDKALKDLWQR
jgi:hypothetical protein